MTLHNYIAHLNGAGPMGHMAHRDAPPGLARRPWGAPELFFVISPVIFTATNMYGY